MKVICFTVIIFFLFASIQGASATEPIPITFSGNMDKVIFDGKWSFYTEWKSSSLNTFSYDDGTKIQFRSAHQNNFIYMFADVINNSHFSKGSDNAMICFDGNNNKTSLPDEDDYCFMAILDGKEPFAYQGGSTLGFDGNFKRIQNPEGFIGIGRISDINDRYSKISHPGYEFRIPTSVVGRSNDYTFYFAMYDAHSNKFYTWPQNITVNSAFQIPNPSVWGDLISPDSSLPEFPWPAVILASAFTTIFFFSKNRFGFYNK